MGCGKATKGPWTLDKRIGCTVVSDDVVVCSTRATHSNNRDPEEQEAEFQANATLISAAPDMLQALEAVEWAGPQYDNGVTIINTCPHCGMDEPGGHSEACPIGNALKKAKG